MASVKSFKLDPRHHRDRGMLHKNQLQAFLAWVETQGYMIHPRSTHKHEVARIEKYTPEGNNPHCVFYMREPPTQHVTLDKEGLELVERWLRVKKRLKREAKDVPA